MEPEVTEQKEEVTESEKDKEIVEVKKKKKVRKGSYTLGTIGAILGGAVAAIPWVLLYAFVNSMVIPLLAMLIPMGAYLGYRIFRGRISKESRTIITIVSLLIITLVVTIISPTILVMQSSYDLNWENIEGLYSKERKNIWETFLEDLVVGLVFTIIGLVIVIKFFINKKAKNVEEEIKLLLTKELKVQSEAIKKACIDLNCMSKENAVEKKQILEQLKIVYNIKNRKAKLYLKNCLSNKLLIKYKGKYYYDETDETTKIENVKKIRNRYISPIKIIITILVIAIIAVAIVFYMETTYTVTGTNIKLNIDPLTQELYGTTEEISEGIGSTAAQYYTFIIEEKNEKYEISGQLISKSTYEETEVYDIDSAIQQDRDYFATLFGEDETSAIEDKELGGKTFKSYHYNYISNTDKECKSQVYLYELEESYLWIEARSLKDVDMTEIDQVIENLFK